MYKLKKGDHVAIIAPSAQIGDYEKIRQGIEYLQKLGFIPVFGKHVYAQNRYMAGSDEQRAADVNEAFLNPKIKAVLCVRAAAGTARILPYVDYLKIRRHPKPLIGFCDNAALQAALFKKSRIISYNGFLPTYDFKNGDADPLVKNSLEMLLKGKNFLIRSGEKIRGGAASGRLLCINLSVLMHLAGTPYFPELKGKILLLEDVNEKIYKIDTMLQQLKQQPHFNMLRGIVFGQFTNCTGDEEDGTIDDCFADFLQNTNFPAMKNFQFGHVPQRYVLPFGAKVQLSTDDECLEILKY